jgi:dihydroorotase
METTYDLLISGGELINPGAKQSGRFDIAIKDGKIAAIAPEINPNLASKRLDAGGQIVTPGLIDLHTHIYWGVTYWGIEADPVAARTGVTGWVDAGSAGAYTFPGFRRYVKDASRARIYCLLNLSAIGLVAPTWEFANPDYSDLALAERTVEENRDFIVGIKARIDQNTTRGVGIKPLEQARELADRVKLPLMVHIGYGPPSLNDILPLLRAGDILTHCFTGGTHRIVGPDGLVYQSARELQERGILLDIGHGTGSFSFPVAESAMAQQIIPDIISSDIHQLSVQGPMFDMPMTISKFLQLGMSLSDAIERSTVRPAQAIGLEGAGTLTVGAPADIALFRLEENELTLFDSQMTERIGKQQLVSTHTLVDGVELERRPELPPAIWATLPEHQQRIKQ